MGRLCDEYRAVILSTVIRDIDGPVQDRRNSIANTLELRPSWTNS